MTEERIYNADGRWFVDGLPREYVIREGVAYERKDGEKIWRVYGRIPIGRRIGGSRRA